MTSEILGLFANTLTGDDKYSLHNTENLPQPIQMVLSKNIRIFVNFLLHVSNLHKILNILKKNINLIGSLFPKL